MRIVFKFLDESNSVLSKRHTNKFSKQKDDRNDSYYDKTPGNDDVESHYNISNYQKEINLNADQVSHIPDFLEPKTPSHQTFSQLKFRGRQYSRCFDGDNLNLEIQNLLPDSEVIINDERHPSTNNNNPSHPEFNTKFKNYRDKHSARYKNKSKENSDSNEECEIQSFNK